MQQTTPTSKDCIGFINKTNITILSKLDSFPYVNLETKPGPVRWQKLANGEVRSVVQESTINAFVKHVTLTWGFVSSYEFTQTVTAI